MLSALPRSRVVAPVLLLALVGVTVAYILALGSGLRLTWAPSEVTGVTGVTEVTGVTSEAAEVTAATPQAPCVDRRPEIGDQLFNGSGNKEVFSGLVNSWYTWKSLNFPDSASCPPRLPVLCALRRLARRHGTELLEAHSPFPWPGALPNVSLAQGAVGGTWRSCAVVASAGSLLNAELGHEIDSHDAVMRFNSAPTAGFERHVGSKTTIRLINTKIVTQRKYKFSSSPLYRNVSLVLWETPPRPCNITTWYARKGSRFFSLYASLRRSRPGQHFALLPPCFLWGLWELLQRNAGTAKIRRTSPSSGFLGLMFMVSLCDEVTAYDFVPSMERASLLCHYFQRGSGAACSLGGFHPRGHEKLLALRMSSRPPRDAFQSGLLKLPGINGLSCGEHGGGGDGGGGGDDGGDGDDGDDDDGGGDDGDDDDGGGDGGDGGGEKGH